jgi:hypothetical protein
MLSLVTAFLTTTLPAKPMQAPPPPPPRATRTAGSAAIAYGRFHLRLLQKPARGFVSTDSRLFRFDHDSAMVYDVAEAVSETPSAASSLTASASFRYASGARCALDRLLTRVKRGQWRHDSKQRLNRSRQFCRVNQYIVEVSSNDKPFSRCLSTFTPSATSH